MNAVVTQDQPRLPTLQSGGAIRPIVPQDFDGAWRIANAVVKAGMAPKGLETPEKAMVAIMHGLEVGMTPMAALQSIAVINSRATIWGDGALGLVQASGKMESHKEWFEGTGDTRKAFCKVSRKGDPEPKHGEFSVADAKKASLWGKAGPWQQYPDRMLKMRARAFALRDGFSDVLKGLGIAEEVQDVQPMRDITPPTPPRPPVPPSAQLNAPATAEVEEAEIIEPEAAQVDEPSFTQEVEHDQVTGEVAEDDEITPSDMLTAMDSEMETLSTEADMHEAWNKHDILSRLTHVERGTEFTAIAKATFARHLKRVGNAKGK